MEYLPVNKIYHKDENSVSGLVEVSIEGLKYYLDPFCENEDLIQANSLKFIMRDYYNLTIAQMWNLVHGFDKDEKHYCQTCGVELGFVKLSRGGFLKFCSQSCASTNTMTNLNLDWWSGVRHNSYTGSLEMFARIEHSFETNKDLVDNSYSKRFLYILENSDSFKIGIYKDCSIQDLKIYFNSKEFNYDKIRLYRDDKFKVIDTEFEIKIFNKDYQILNSGERGWTETFPIQRLEESLKLIKLKPFE